MKTYKIYSSKGQKFQTTCNNIMEAEKKALKILTEEGDYFEILGETLISRVTKQEGRCHWNHPNFKFESYDKKLGIKNGISLFK
jgi:hypothetical protein